MKFLGFSKRFIHVLFSPDCRLFTIIVGVSVIFLMLILPYTFYSARLRDNNEKLIIAANNIDIFFSENLNEIRNLMFYIGKEIAVNEEEDINLIVNILLNNQQILTKHKGTISGTAFGWINRENLTTISGLHHNGKDWINNKLIDVSHRSYVQTCHQYPWTLQVSHPEIGLTSGLWVIPVALGVTNFKGQYLGALMTGIEIFKLSTKIQQILNPNIEFIVLDRDLKIVIKSTNNSIDPKSSFYRDLLNKFDFFSSNSSFLNNPIEYKNIKYSFYKKFSSDYPYVILTGFTTEFTYKSFLIYIIFHVLILLFIGLFFLFLVYFLWKKNWKNSFETEQEREEFLGDIQRENKKTQEETKKIIISIAGNCGKLLNYFKERDSNTYVNHQQIKIIEEISKSISYFHLLTTPKIMNSNLNFLDVNQAIKDCLVIHRNTSISKEISINSYYDKDLPLIYINTLYFKKMILGLFFLSTETSSFKGHIKISTIFISSEGKNQLKLILEDDGIGFDKDDIHRLQLNNNNNYFSGMDLSSIEQFISVHKGIFCLDRIFPRGKKFSILLPYDIDHNIGEKEDDLYLADNIIIFPKSPAIH